MLKVGEALPERKDDPNRGEGSKGDIFSLLVESSKNRAKARRAEFLGSEQVKEFFDEGTITVNHRTCQGVECDLCIKACPTNALYWQDGEIGITQDLCIYCGACVLNCIVDDCIEVNRKRPDGRVESFSKPSDVVLLCRRVNSRSRRNRVESVFPDTDAYVKRYGGL
jgi:ferredoxin